MFIEFEVFLKTDKKKAILLFNELVDVFGIEGRISFALVL